MNLPNPTVAHLDGPTKGLGKVRTIGLWVGASIGILSLFCFGWVAEAARNRNGFSFESTVLLVGWAVLPLLIARSLTRSRRWAALNAKRRLLVLILGLFGSSSVALSGYITSDLVHDNLRVVVPAQAYRAGQMTSDALAATIRTYGIKSILNLRGSNALHSWYQKELQTTTELHVLHYDFGISAGQELQSRDLNEIAGILRNAAKPILIHCYGGADRSGLASAIYLYSIAGKPAENAAGELSVWNGHVPMLRPSVRAMDNSFWRYVSNRLAQAESGTQPDN